MQLSTLITILTASVVYYNYPNVDPNLRPINILQEYLLTSYDFIVVGGGSAGSVMANRLTEVENWNVLLLEVGGDETVLTDTPLLPFVLFGSNVDWNYTTVPQQNACLYNNVCYWPRGRVLGGSSTTNFMIYDRGNMKDYNEWMSLGNIGWSYEEVLPYFILSEDNQNSIYANTQYHGTGGYLTVSEADYITPLAHLYIQAGIELGYTDLNGANQTGFMLVQGTLRNGSRCSTAKAYLRPARNRTNLAIVERAFVTKIIFNGTKATGVTYIRNNIEYNISASKEIIISAGAVNTPQLLMLSGVGPSENLQRLSIPVIQDLKVGYNLQDHIGVSLLFNTNPPLAITDRDYRNFEAIIEYSYPPGTGPLTIPMGIEAESFLSQNGSPDIQITFNSYGANLNNDTNPDWYGTVSILRPESKGRIVLSSTNPFEHPLIDPGYLSSVNDIQKGIYGIKTLFDIANTTSLRSVQSQFQNQLYPLCQTFFQFLTLSYFECLLRTYSGSSFNPAGTCKMGPRTDPDAVVDPWLNVYGIDNLRVVDSSVMPFVTSGHTNAPTIMIAERASDIIKVKYRQTPRIRQNSTQQHNSIFPN